MGKHHLIEAFMRGDIDRRAFIGRLSAIGVTAGAATAHVSTPALASVSPAASGSIARYQLNQEEDYGTAFTFDTLEEAIQILRDVHSITLGILGALSTFAIGAIETEIIELLERLTEQQQEQAIALAALIGIDYAEPDQIPEFATTAAFFAALSASLDVQVSAYAAIAPAIGDGEIRQTITNIAIVVGGHAAVAHAIASENPLPGAFAEPLLP